MAVTSKGFKGDEERQFQPDDQYGSKGDSAEALLHKLASQQNDPASHGEQVPYDAGSGTGGGPRRHGTAQPQTPGNEASTGKAGPWPAGAANQPGPKTTGAGQGSKTIKTYGPGSK